MSSRVYIGTRADGQALQLAKYFDHFLDWQDLGEEWHLEVSNETAALIVGSVKLSVEELELYTRFPSHCLRETEEVFVLLRLLYGDRFIFRSDPELSIAEKATQLIDFGSSAPPTLVTNSPTRAKIQSGWVLKSVGPSRVTVQGAEAVATVRSRLSVPVLLQKKIEGTEFKLVYHEPTGSAMAIEVRSEALDYRTLDSPVSYRCIEADEDAIFAAKTSSRLLGVDLVDVDFIRVGERLMTLEHNDSSPFAYLEQLGGGEGSFTEKLMARQVEALILCGKSDRTYVSLQEALLQKGLKIAVLFYEDLQANWDFSFQAGRISFHLSGQVIAPRFIFDRGCQIENASNQKKLLGQLVDLLNLTEQVVVPRPSSNYLNGSKMEQLIKHIDRAARDGARLLHPASTILKGLRRTSLSGKIVKSLSGIRSIVVDDSIFGGWEAGSLASVPALFQERIAGNDARTHVFLGEDLVHMELSSTKDSTDYRYGPHAPRFRLVQNLDAESRQMNRAIADEEKNSLVGVDWLIDDENRWFFLEANPSPGWGYFARHCDDPDEARKMMWRGIGRIVDRSANVG
jgi:hypothetical protein